MQRASRSLVWACAVGAVALAGACSGSDGSAEDPGGGLPEDGGSSGDGGSTTGDGAAPCGVDGGEPCPAGAKCTTDDECEATCVAGACTTPTHNDGKVSPSLGETDVDCGGPTAPKCAEGLTCAVDGDCTTAVCSAKKKCVSSPSCRGTAGPEGVETCGTGEPGAAGATVESCCRSLPLPVRTTRALDRYTITSGRVREFVTQVAASQGGVPNVRAFAKAYAAANPTSELGVVATSYPGLLDVLPDHAGPSTPVPLPVHLGAFPLDPMNSLDGCFMTTNGYGHATYWQPPGDLKPLGVGYPAANPDGVRKYGRDVLDEKPMNCVMALFLAAFCAWDGGELARTQDYHEVWGRRPTAVGNATIYIPWATIQPIGKFNWRNGHGDACPFPWPGCVNPQPYHYTFPSAAFNPANDDTPAIGAPGRFPDDVTAITSAGGEGWFDVGGNLMEAAWPVGAVNTGANPITNVCDVSATAGPGEVACMRQGRPGVRRYAGSLPHIALVGYSFEGHARRSEAYLSAVTPNESLIGAGDLKPVTFQYGKVGGRCARPVK